MLRRHNRENNLYSRVTRKDFKLWTLLSVTAILAAVTVSTPILLNKYNKGLSPVDPGSNPGAASCTLNFSLNEQPCNNLDIVGVSIDRSGSMTGRESDGRQKIVWAKEAAVKLVEAVQAKNTTSIRLGVNSFGAQGNDGTGVLGSSFSSTLNSPLTNNYSSVINAINNIRHIESGTCVECGLRLSNQQVANTSTRKIAILLSDGKANHKWDGTTGGTPNPRQF